MYNLRVNPYQTNINFNASSKVKNELPLAEKISNSLNKLYASSEREVAEYDYFKTVQVAFDNPDKNLYVGTVKLKISQLPKESGDNYKTQRYLEAVVYSPTKGQNISMIFSVGNKKEILEKLKDEKLVKEIEEFVKESSGMLIEESY